MSTHEGFDLVAELLAELRAGRAISADDLLASKVGRCAAWFAQESIDAAVVGLSGGIDSAVVLGLLEAVRAVPDSPLRRVVACIVPIDGDGATGQADAEQRARSVADHFGSESWGRSSGARACRNDRRHRGGISASSRRMDGGSAAVGRAHSGALWGCGSAAVGRSSVGGRGNHQPRRGGGISGSSARRPTAPSTLQPISDLHKSEVRSLARVMGVPECVLTAPAIGRCVGRSNRRGDDRS